MINSIFLFFIIIQICNDNLSSIFCGLTGREEANFELPVEYLQQWQKINSQHVTNSLDSSSPNIVLSHIINEHVN